MKNISIQIKIVSIIIFILLLITAIALYISIDRQKEQLFEAKKTTLLLNTEQLNETIKSIMTVGEAPIAVVTMKNLQNIGDFKEISIYRTDGSIAFNDYKTLDFVNKYQNVIMFPKTDRVKKISIDNENFRYVLDNEKPIDHEIKETQDMEYFYPIRNIDICQKCHGDPTETGSLRGIAHFKISISDIYKQINSSRLFLIILFIVLTIILAAFIIFFIQIVIIRPLFKIGKTVTDFGEGNLDLNVDIYSGDELGKLAEKINIMFQGVRERIKLSKYVSKSTDEIIKKGEAETEKKLITVLFSDIRGFTSYSEKHKPEEVIENLNRILQVQADTVEKYGGDIDKFVGDELMAVFMDEYTATKSAYEMIYKVNYLNNEYNTDLHVGIGINTGEVIAGNIGSKNRLEYAVIGDTVNLASRLCGIAKENMMLISEKTYEKIKDKIKAKLISGQKIKGKTESINFYVVQSLIKE